MMPATRPTYPGRSSPLSRLGAGLRSGVDRAALGRQPRDPGDRRAYWPSRRFGQEPEPFYPSVGLDGVADSSEASWLTARRLARSYSSADSFQSGSHAHTVVHCFDDRSPHRPAQLV